MEGTRPACDFIGKHRSLLSAKEELGSYRRLKTFAGSSSAGNSARLRSLNIEVWRDQRDRRQPWLRRELPPAIARLNCKLGRDMR